MVALDKQYLADTEELLQTWEGNLIDEVEEDSTPAAFGMTDRRLLCVTEDNEFKDVGYSHISSIEAESDTESSFEGKDYRMLIGLGVLFVFPGAWIWNTVSIWMVLVSLVLGVLMVVTGWDNRDDPEWNSFETVEHDVHTIRVITGDELTKRLVFATQEDVAGDLSYTVRQLG